MYRLFTFSHIILIIFNLFFQKPIWTKMPKNRIFNIFFNFYQTKSIYSEFSRYDLSRCELFSMKITKQIELCLFLNIRRTLLISYLEFMKPFPSKSLFFVRYKIRILSVNNKKQPRYIDLWLCLNKYFMARS